MSCLHCVGEAVWGPVQDLWDRSHGCHGQLDSLASSLSLLVRFCPCLMSWGSRKMGPALRCRGLGTPGH